jgi:hypothetical protein
LRVEPRFPFTATNTAHSPRPRPQQLQQQQQQQQQQQPQQQQQRPARPQFYAQRRYSASATLLRTLDDDLLKPPPRFVRRAPASFPPLPYSSTSGTRDDGSPPYHACSTAAMMAAPAVSPAFHDTYHHVVHQPAHYPGKRGSLPAERRLQAQDDFVARTDRANARHLALSSSSTSTPRSERPVTNNSHPEPTPYPERPGMYPRPRRTSAASNASSMSLSTSASMASRDSIESRMRSSSWSSQTSFESFYSAASAPYSANGRNFSAPHLAWQRPQPLKALRPRPPARKPGEMLAALPGEALELILSHLRAAHLAAGADSCATCWMRDATSMAVAARKMLKYARAALYQDIELVGPEGERMRKRHKTVAFGHRLELLRRTLRASPGIAASVRPLKPPAAPAGVDGEQYLDLVASVVMACPNLERLAGFYPGHDHSFSRLAHALSTRRRLKAHAWLLDPSRFQRQARIHAVAGPQRHRIAPGDLQPAQSAEFLDAHADWAYLSALTVHARPGATLSPDTLLVDALMYLPALRELTLSHLPHTAFHDAALLALPPLRRLSLCHVPGVTSAGLSAFATRGTSRALESLTLVHAELDSLAALARLLANCRDLKAFTFVQRYPPVLPLDDPIVLFPYLASASLRRLHWDVPADVARANTADVVLARSIAADGFPALRRLRAPADPEGLFQGLCRPRERVDLPSDRFRGGKHHHRARSTASAGARSPMAASFPAEVRDDGPPREHSDLHLARLDAQARLENARGVPRFFVNVVDEDGVLVDKYGVAGFLGQVGSKVSYHLVADPGGVDENGGLVGIEELTGDGGEDLGQGEGHGGNAREGCCGKWNVGSVGMADKKDKERWWHTERGRWRGVTLS